MYCTSIHDSNGDAGDNDGDTGTVVGDDDSDSDSDDDATVSTAPPSTADAGPVPTEPPSSATAHAPVTAADAAATIAATIEAADAAAGKSKFQPVVLDVRRTLVWRKWQVRWQKGSPWACVVLYVPMAV